MRRGDEWGHETNGAREKKKAGTLAPDRGIGARGVTRIARRPRWGASRKHELVAAAPCANVRGGAVASPALGAQPLFARA